MKISRILKMIGLLALLFAIGSLGSVPGAAQERYCYKLVSTVTILDETAYPGGNYDLWRKIHTFTREPDGSIKTHRYIDYGGQSLDMQIWLDQGKFVSDRKAADGTTGHSEVTWTVPPQVWCSDQDFTLTITATSTKNTGGSGRFGAPFQRGYKCEGMSPGQDVGAGDWSTGLVPSNSGSCSGLRPEAGRDKWSLWLYLSSAAAELEDFHVGYNYEYMPPGALPPPAVAIPSSWGCTKPGIEVNAVDNDPENQLGWCDNRVGFGDERGDKGRCFSFRYQVPPGGVTSAFLHLAIKPQGDADTDNIIAAVGQPQQECGDAGKMPGCVVLHGGLAGYKDHVDIDLLNNGCDPAIRVSDQAKQALAAQLQTGVLHVRLQDDTILYSAQLVLNCDPSCPPSGQEPGEQQPPAGPGAPGTTLPMPPYGQPEPNTNVPRMTLQAGQRRVVEGGLVNVPVWLINGKDVANTNFTVDYRGSVAVPEGDLIRGSLLDRALFEFNTAEADLIRIGFAQTSGINGTGTVTYVPFRAVGKAGDRTELHLEVTTINDPGGTVLTIDRIDGAIQIVGPDGLVPGDCNNDGSLTQYDAACALQISVRLRPVILALDIDDNGEVTSRDATIILQRATRPLGTR